MPKQEEVISAELAAKRLNIKARRMREIAAERKLERLSVTDPETGRVGVAYRAAAIEQVRKDMMEQAVQRYAPVAAPEKITAAPAAAKPVFALPGAVAAPDVVRPWVTLAEAAEISGLPEKTLIRLVREGRLPAIDHALRYMSAWRVKRAALESLDGD